MMILILSLLAMKNWLFWINTLKEQITYEANLRKKNVQFNTKFKPASIFKILEILNPKIEKIFNLEKEYTLIKAFKELGTNVQLNDLPEEYIKILNKTSEIESNYSKRTINLKYYKSIVEQLLIDMFFIYENGRLRRSLR